MSGARVHRSSPSRQKRYRDKLRAMGLSASSGKHVSKFDGGEFVAIDGEGFNVGADLSYIVGQHDREYITHDHEYALLSASDGTEVYNPFGRLTTQQCLDFLLDITIRQPKAIVVCFGASYDMCHMLAHGLTRDEIDTLLHGDGSPLGRKYVDVTLGDYDYRLELRNRKSLSVWRWSAGADKYVQKRKKDGTRQWKMTPHDKVVLWDVWGFFQGTFVDALKQWLPDDPDTALIADMKAKRSTFQRSEIVTVRTYNDKELRCLVDLMNKVRDAIRALDLKITRWDGAGAIAGGMLQKHEIKAHMAQSPPEVFNAARIAYSGGHIEACKLGYHNGVVHHYDINSAYPAQFTKLPSLANGDWHHGHCGAGREPPEGFTMVKLAFRFKPGLPFYPLFYRQENSSILYPERGCGWYWFPEYAAALRFKELFGAIEFTVLEYWYFKPSLNVAPFAFIEDAYLMRMQIVEESKRTGKPDGREKTLKLGYNSIYGKAAQQVGARWQDGEIVQPAYFQLEWAGYVTSGCRATLMEAACQAPASIISFATDGLFSLDPLQLYTPARKELGAWEYQQHLGMTMVMPGVYWLHDEPTAKKPNGLTGYSRGMDKATMSDVQFVHQAWRKRQDHIIVPASRMITLGTSTMSDSFWNMRGTFPQTGRELKLNGGNSKRYPAAMSSVKPHQGMIDLVPRDIDEDYWQDVQTLCSAPYPISWDKVEDAIEVSAQVAEISDADRSFYFDRQASFLA